MAEHGNGSTKLPSGGQGDGTRESPVNLAAKETESRPSVRQRVTGFFESTTKVLVAVGGLIAAITGLVTLVIHLLPGAHVTPPSGPPVKIDAVVLVRTVGQAGTYVFPQRMVLAAAELRTLNQFNLTQPQYDAWFRSRGAVDPDSSNLKLVVEGNRNHPVEITGLRLIKHCQQPLSGTLFLSPPAGAEYNVEIGFNLDSTASIAQDYRGYSYYYRLSGDYFAEHTISLSRGEVQTLQVVAVTVRQYCAYTLQLTAVDGSTTVTENITDHGRPFGVSAVNWVFKNSEFAYYKALYVGGVAAHPPGPFAYANPATYKGY